MRLLMTPAQVTLTPDRRPKTVTWSSPRSEPSPARPPEPPRRRRTPARSHPADPPPHTPEGTPEQAPERTPGQPERAPQRPRGEPQEPPPAAPSRPSRPEERPARRRYVVHVLDAWRYDGRWWEEHELHRDYYFLELDGGTRLELFREGERWWAARAND